MLERNLVTLNSLLKFDIPTGCTVFQMYDVVGIRIQRRFCESTFLLGRGI